MARKEINSEIRVEFTPPDNRVNIQSGEDVRVLFGKLRRYLSDLKPVAFSGNYEDLTGAPALSLFDEIIEQKINEKFEGMIDYFSELLKTAHIECGDFEEQSSVVIIDGGNFLDESTSVVDFGSFLDSGGDVIDYGTFDVETLSTGYSVDYGEFCY